MDRNSCAGRASYRTEEDAQKAAEKQQKIRQFPHSPYYCHECGQFHLRGFNWGKRKG